MHACRLSVSINRRFQMGFKWREYWELYDLGIEESDPYAENAGVNVHNDFDATVPMNILKLRFQMKGVKVLSKKTGSDDKFQNDKIGFGIGPGEH